MGYWIQSGIGRRTHAGNCPAFETPKKAPPFNFQPPGSTPDRAHSARSVRSKSGVYFFLRAQPCRVRVGLHECTLLVLNCLHIARISVNFAHKLGIDFYSRRFTACVLLFWAPNAQTTH